MIEHSCSSCKHSQNVVINEDNVSWICAVDMPIGMLGEPMDFFLPFEHKCQDWADMLSDVRESEHINNETPLGKKQIGGTHYLNKIEPWEIIDSWKLNFYEGNILKYLLRDKSNRVEDLQKLIHYAEKIIEMEEMKIRNEI